MHALKACFVVWAMFSDRIVLRMYRAREITYSEAPELVGMVEELSARANLPMPHPLHRALITHPRAVWSEKNSF